MTFLASHGESSPETKEYSTWRSMKERCLNARHAQFARYGGRGIGVCERWLSAYANFLADMGRAPNRAHSIERIDNAGNYEPGNCRWATSKEQCRNRRSSRLVTVNGVTLPLAAWAERTGICWSTLSLRLNRGMTPELAVTTPPDSRYSTKRRRP